MFENSFSFILKIKSDMNLTERAINDVKRITSNSNEWGVEITLIKPVTSECITITGLHSKHHFAIDGDGNNINSKHSYISFSENSLIDFSIRNARNEVVLTKFLVIVKDSTGNEKNYMVREFFPDEKLGLIVCILMDFKAV